MYVDDSGSPSMRDNSDYYVVSGAIIHELDIRQVEIRTQQYKKKHFREYAKEEIHVHDIYKSQRGFSGLTINRKYELLDTLYEFVETLPITIISVGIDKPDLLRERPQWHIFNAAWTFLIERFDRYIIDSRGRDRGIIIVDKSSKIPENEISRIVNLLRRNGSYFQPEIENIVEEPIFVESRLREGIQIADSCAYCTLKHLTAYDKFKPYWKIIEGKLRRGPNGNTAGYGFKVFPH